MKDQFIIFLAQYRALDKFKANVESTLCSCLNESYNSIFELNAPEQYLLDAFYWDLTPEGEAYWGFIYTKWQKRLEFLNN